ncbi:thioesterase family protein [Labilibaculum antarcticum]|uniref:Dihydrolipoamide acyltransferase n=1 Tax=Labilibaculum antarcticum TaxID=1717717 RepID=A0A1Y1CEE0_9BACT|nr:thioesterase family protein [Labilibaculum antarcticum]BAX78694.1 dihydrolipoamide acyltransferase [Labilibaculum antarcticum]
MALAEGLTVTQTMTVTKLDTAIHHGSGKLEVFATPAMVAFMENTALACIAPEMEKGTDSVGIQIDTKHSKANKVGTLVTCTAKLVKVDGKKLSFEIEASDEDGKIGSAFHLRYIIDPVKFMSRL